VPDHILAIGDSGTRGAFVLLHASTGDLLGSGQLPLDRGVTDDHEGLAQSGDFYYTITSSGFIRQYRRLSADRFEQIGPAYLLHRSLGCAAAQASNCGHDFEGLCLEPDPGEPDCHGYAASKMRGTLVCLRIAADGRLDADPNHTIQVAPPGALSGCAIAPEGDLLYTGNNLFGANAVFRVHGWRDPRRARLEALGPAGAGFAEAVAVGPGGLLYRLSDTASPRSGAAKYSCAPARR
jgi:hypothetical protein